LDFGGIAFERNREQEFGAKGIPLSALIMELEEIKKMVSTSLLGLNPNRMGDKSLHAFFGHQMSIGFFLIHLYGHLNYHLGQVDYHRRLLGS
jgi:hypothetical protein